MKRTVNLIFLAAAALALALGGVRTLRRDRAVLYYENRMAASAPAPSREALGSGAYFTGLDDFLSDRFAGRDTLIALDTRLDLALGRPVVHGVALGRDAIFPFHGYNTWETGYRAQYAQTMADRLAQVRDQAAAYGGKFYYIGVPEQYSYFHDKYPAYMDDRQWLLSADRAYLAAALAERDIPFVDMAQRFDALGHPDALYSATDHHYTYLGALETYWAVMDAVNADAETPLPVTAREDLTLTDLPNPFLGSHDRMLYGLWPTHEALTIGTLNTPIPFTRRDNGAETAPSLYALPQDEEKTVSYTVYMGGDIGETVIQTNRPDLPKCLIWGDSFTNALETVLWTSFDETRSLDFRYYTGKTLSEYIAAYQPDVILCLRDDTTYLDLSAPNGNIS